MRVLAEWVARSTAARITVYTGVASTHAFAPLAGRATVVPTNEPTGTTGLKTVRALAAAERTGRRVAKQIDAGHHDVAFVFASQLTQAPAVLKFLRTPAVYYSPEPLRTAYEPRELAWAGPGVRNALTRRGLNPVESFRKRLDRRSILKARHVVTHSEFTKTVLRETYGVDARVVLLGVDSTAFTPSGGPPRDPPFVLSVGALSPFKGHHLVVDAIGLIPSPRPRLVIIGDRGADSPSLLDRAANSGVAIEILSNVPFDVVVRTYQEATAIVCAQIREPFGLVPLEAMASGRPVIAVAEGGLLETIDDDVTGIHVSRSASDLASAISRVVRDPSLQRRLGTAGRLDVESNWTWDAYASRVDTLLAEIATAHRG